MPSVNSDLSSHLLTLIPDPDNHVHSEVFAMRQDITRQIDQLRTMEESHDPLFGNKQSSSRTAISMLTK